jgi:hypothetical protein
MSTRRNSERRGKQRPASWWDRLLALPALQPVNDALESLNRRLRHRRRRARDNRREARKAAAEKGNR